MATNILKILRSLTPGNRPSSRVYGEPYVNLGENQFGVMNASNVPQDLLAATNYSTSVNYALNQVVNYSGQLYICTAATIAGAFNPAQWSPLFAWGSYAGGFVNKLRNGSFKLWQRHGTAYTCPSSTLVMVADGWYNYFDQAGCVVQDNGSHQMQIIGSSSALTQCLIQQRIPSDSSITLGGINCTFQIAIFNSTGATFTPTLTIFYANTKDNWASSTTALAATNLQPCANGVWTTVAYTFNVPAAQAALGLAFRLSIPGAAINSNTKSVILANADVRLTPSFPVGLCAYPPPPEIFPMAIEQQLCQRFYEKSYDLTTAPGTVTSTGAAFLYQLISGTGVNLYTMSGSHDYKVKKFALPTLMPYSPTSGAAGYVHDGQNNGDIASPNWSFLSPGTSGFHIVVQVITPATIANLQYHWTADCEL